LFKGVSHFGVVLASIAEAAVVMSVDLDTGGVARQRVDAAVDDEVVVRVGVSV
jgi:hypothetical protein